MGKKTVLEARVADVEKRRYPTKHYAYVLEVNWSEGSSTVVYRRYSDFFEFQCLLLEKFPLEGGANDPAQRMIPFLPGKKLFGRSHTRAVAEKRKEKIDEYCHSLIRLPPTISDCDFVLEFFEVRQTDLEKPQKQPKAVKGQPKFSEISDPLILERFVAIADYEKQKKNECSVVAGQTVEVIDKNENGWWFVNVDDFHEGWVPATYLEPLYGSEDASVRKLDPGEEETWISVNKYVASHHDELSFEKGVLLEVFEKGVDGWWKVRYQGNEGMVPAAYLQQYHGQGAVGQVSTGAQVVSSIKDATSPSSATPTSLTAHPRSATVVSPPTSPETPLSMSMNVSYKDSTASSSDTHKSSVVASLTSSLMAERLSSQTPPTPSPKPVPSSVAVVAAAAVAEKQKFAPTWHSQAKPPVNDEPIYGPTPRRYSFKQPPLQKRDVSSFSSAFPEPVYEIIPEPEAEVYMTIGDFVATAGDGVSFGTGEECTVVTKNSAGWWYVEMGDQEGWVPSSYLERKLSSPAPQSAKSPVSTPAALSIPDKKALLTKKEPLKEAWRDPMKEQRKELPVKKDKKDPPRPPREYKKEPQPRKEEASPLTAARRKSLSRKFSDSVDDKQRPLRRSTSTDSGLYDEVGTKIKATHSLHSPPPVRASGAPPRPSRPKNTPTLPKTKAIASTKSPRGDRKTSLKASISGPMPFQPSPNTKRKLDAASRSLKPTPLRSTSGSDLGKVGRVPVSNPRSPTLRHPHPLKRGGSDEGVDSSWKGSNDTDGAARHTKKNAYPEIKVASLQDASSSSGKRRATGEHGLSPRPVPPHSRHGSTDNATASAYKLEHSLSPRPVPPHNRHGSTDNATAKLEHSLSPRPVPPHNRHGSTDNVTAKLEHNLSSRPVPPHSRHGSTDNATASAYKLELAKKLSGKAGAVQQSPKRPSPPSIASKGGRNPHPESRTLGPPSRPQPFKSGPSKRPPPPRPTISPATIPKKVVYVTVGGYSGEGSSSCLRFRDGEEVEVLEKNNDGWWFVKINDKEGWAPSTYIEERKLPVTATFSGTSCPVRPKPHIPAPQASKRSELEESDFTPKPKPRPRPRKSTSAFYRATESYDVPAYEDSGLTVVKGRVYELVEKSENGWWLMKDGDIEGWAPATHFKMA